LKEWPVYINTLDTFVGLRSEMPKEFPVVVSKGLQINIGEQIERNANSLNDCHDATGAFRVVWLNRSGADKQLACAWCGLMESGKSGEPRSYIHPRSPGTRNSFIWVGRSLPLTRRIPCGESDFSSSAYLCVRYRRSLLPSDASINSQERNIFLSRAP